MSNVETSAESTVLVERHPHMMTLVLNRPRVLNSLNIEMIKALDRALDEVEREERFQFVLLSGAGEKGFCAGGDIRALAEAVRGGWSA
ncbi:MAG TPA: enoyl-CoA hydratase/isomerase family protein, partial [Syntrophobacteria bacterium]|nr:enoyl-CoA hydratase/isomerase family protein [Syntrophobacteria bacterium]